MQMRFPVRRSLTLTMVLCVLAIIPLSAQQQNGGPQNTGTKPATGSEKAEVRTEKFKVKQEFGPQTVARRGDRTTTVTPPSQGSSSSGTGSAQSSSAHAGDDVQFNPQATAGTQKTASQVGNQQKSTNPKSKSSQ
jgi:hypothetical protein